jgi:hypothetical protein
MLVIGLRLPAVDTNGRVVPEEDAVQRSRVSDLLIFTEVRRNSAVATLRVRIE